LNLVASRTSNVATSDTKVFPVLQFLTLCLLVIKATLFFLAVYYNTSVQRVTHKVFSAKGKIASLEIKSCSPL
jgi:hypothetical protein